MTQVFKTTLLMIGMVLFFMLIGYFIGGQSGMIIALVMAGISNFAMYFWSDKLVIKMQGAKPLGNKYPSVVRIVTDLAQRENIPMPNLHYVDTAIPNAFATGRSPNHAVVAVTSGIMEILDENELRGVLAHELGHVINRDMLVSTIAATMAGAISYLAQFAIFFGGDSRNRDANPIAMIAAMLLGPIAALIIQMAVSRSREYLADKHSFDTLGDGQYLASALAKLEGWKRSTPPIQPTQTEQATASLMFANMFNMQGLASLFSTHPSTADRIERLESYRNKR